MKTILFALLLSGIASISYAQAPTQDTLHSTSGRSVSIPGRCFAMLDYKLPRTRVGLERNLHRVPRHPGLDSLLSPAEKAEVLAEINVRCDALGKDSLLTSDLFWVMRPYYDRLHHEDPHYRITTVRRLPSLHEKERPTQAEPRTADAGLLAAAYQRHARRRPLA